MSLTTRRIIAITFFIFFMVSAPMLILYTAGFRYNLKKAQLTKTGALVLDTEPSGANIFLNEQKIKSKTPVRLNNILPDEYSIKIEKEGYYPWNKKLTIATQATTFAEDIVLFKKSSPTTIKSQTNKSVWIDFSPDKKFALYVEQDSTLNSADLSFLNLNNRKLEPLIEIKNLETSSISWSKNGSLLFLYAKDKPFIFSTFEPTRKISLPNKDGQSESKNFRWSNESNELLFFQRDNDLFEFNISTNVEEKMFSLPNDEALLDYFVFDKKIYLIEKISGKTFLTKQPAKSGDTQNLSKAIELKNDAFKFDSTYRGLLSFKDLTNQAFYLIDTDLNKIYFQKESVISADLHKNGYLLLIATGQELSFLDLRDANPQEKIITRYSQGLQKAKWHSSSNYAFVLRDGLIDIIELDDRSGHQITNITTMPAVAFSTDAKSQTVFFLEANKPPSTELQYLELD
ncbi:MAG: PEGA domain-containing protein [Patescibacteria group bacterium]